MYRKKICQRIQRQKYRSLKQWEKYLRKLKKEFREDDDESRKVAELKQVEQGR